MHRSKFVTDWCGTGSRDADKNSGAVYLGDRAGSDIDVRGRSANRKADRYTLRGLVPERKQLTGIRIDTEL